MKKLPVVALATLTLSTCVSAHGLKNWPTVSYVTFASTDMADPRMVSAELRVPVIESSENEGDHPLPAVVVVHGSAGIDSRGAFYIEQLNKKGYVTLELDLWSTRGWVGPIKGRPSGVPETLGDAFGALKYLSELPFIEAEHIGILGFSWGGVVSMLTATEPYQEALSQDDLSFAAHIAHYPVCWSYNLVPGYEFMALTGAPVLIQSGKLDDYDGPETCDNLKASLPAESQSHIDVKMYGNAYHAFDRLEPMLVVEDPYSHEGAGGEVVIKPNRYKAKKARHSVIKFFDTNLQ
ncbi:MAG: dienelactone hydrolase family protein [Pseudomonadales bacterium]|nr:dienelactone hydrolase family protein [Pseudomonadales bacterium]